MSSQFTNKSVGFSSQNWPKITLVFQSDSSGKEKDAETGYHYFGARYYNSDLSIWLSVDPMSDKYPSFSPYNYCAWNPVKIVDPMGREIWIIGSDGNSYQYKDGKLYTKDGSLYDGNDDFATQVMSDLNTLKENGMNDQIESLVTSKKTHTINKSQTVNTTRPENEDNISNLTGSSTKINYNPSLEEFDGWKRKPVVGLAHEMQHSYEMDNGTYDNSTVLLKKIIYCGEFTLGTKTKYIGDYNGNHLRLSVRYEYGEFEMGELSAIRTANMVHMNLGGQKTRSNIKGFPITY